MRSTNGSGVEKEAGDVQLSRLYAYLRKEEEQWTVHGVAADDTEKVQTKLNEVKAELRRRMHEPIPKQGKWLRAVVVTLSLLRSAHEPTGLAVFGSESAGFGIARCRGAAKTAASSGTACGVSSLAGCLCLLSVIPILCAAWRCYLRQEPDAGNPLVRIRGGGHEQS